MKKKWEDLDDGENFIAWATGHFPDKPKCTADDPCGECMACEDRVASYDHP